MFALKQIVKQSIKQTQKNNLSLISSKNLYHFSRKSKHAFKVDTQEDLINVKTVQYPFDQPEEGVYSPEKPKLFVSSLKKRELEAKQKKEFIIYQQELKRKADQKLTDSQQKQGKSEQEKEFLWENGVPPSRPYDNVTNKELTYIYRDSKYFQRSDRMISHLSEFQQPFTIHDQEIRELIDFIKEKATAQNIQNSDVDFVLEEIYENTPEISEKLQQLASQIPKISYKLLPNLGLALAYELRYKIDYAGVWQAYLEVLNKNIHHFSPLEMAQIKYALNGTYPKVGTPALHKAFQDIVSQELHLCTLKELMYLAQAFRNTRKDRIQGKILSEIRAKSSQISSPDDLAHIIYTYASCRVKTANRNKLRIENEELVEATEYFETFLDQLLAQIPQMSAEAVVKLGVSMAILRLPNVYQDILLRIENNLRKNVAQLDSTLLPQVFYMFSKMQNGLGYGSAAFFQELLPVVESQFQEYTNNERAKILYALTQRKQISEAQFGKIFLPWLKKRNYQLQLL